jgi:murein DD-endopeptidase MepM/ murein hydrolase activator NlpD
MTSSLLPVPAVAVGALGLEYESRVAADLGFQPADPSQIDLLWPVETRTVSSAWGPRIRTRSVRVVKASTRKSRKVKVAYRSSHKGVDLNAPSGTDVYASMDARVVTAGKHRQYGNYVVLDHGNGVQTLYAHLSALHTSEGEIVRRGQKIGLVGRTGNATGPHLHFELIEAGQRQNPLPFLNDVEEIPAEMMALNNALPRLRQAR